MKVITWVDLQGRYRVTSPAYNDPTCPDGETEDECIERTWVDLVEKGPYQIDASHPRFHVEDADQRTSLIDCCGTYFRYGGIPRPDIDGSDRMMRDARDGAWEMGLDGLPIVSMVKAAVVQMDKIRVARSIKLVELDDLQNRAMGSGDDAERIRIQAEKQILLDLPITFDLSSYKTPATLKAAWPTELPVRD